MRLQLGGTTDPSREPRINIQRDRDSVEVEEEDYEEVVGEEEE